MKNFCRFNLENDKIFDIIYVGSVLKMHRIWLEINKKEEVTVLEFNRAIVGAVNFLRRALRESRNLDEFNYKIVNL